MRVIVPYVPGKLSERTVAALAEQAPHLELIDVSTSPTAYHALLASLWWDAETFLLVEMDVIVAAGTVAALEACPEPWCACRAATSARYPRSEPPHFQCVRFRREIMLANPLACDLPMSRRHWATLDSQIAGRIDGDAHEHPEHLTEHLVTGDRSDRALEVGAWRRAYGERFASKGAMVGGPLKLSTLKRAIADARTTTTQRRATARSSGASPLADNSATRAPVDPVRQALAPSSAEQLAESTNRRAGRYPPGALDRLDALASVHNCAHSGDTGCDLDALESRNRGSDIGDTGCDLDALDKQRRGAAYSDLDILDAAAETNTIVLGLGLDASSKIEILPAGLFRERQGGGVDGRLVAAIDATGWRCRGSLALRPALRCCRCVALSRASGLFRWAGAWRLSTASSGCSLSTCVHVTTAGRHSAMPVGG